MKTSTPKTLLTALAAGSLFFSGCFRDESPTGGGNQNGMSATFEGRVQGDAAVDGLGKRSSQDGGVEGAIVTVARIKSDGSLETVSTAEVKADVQGRFSVKAAADGARELVVVARKEGREWKAVVSAKAEDGRAIACRPLNIESSIEADVLAKVRGSGASEVSFADIAARIDAEVAMQVEAQAETGADAKADAEAWLSARLRAECKARTEALVSSAGGFTLAQIDKANEARMDAEARFEADLEAAADLSVHGTISADAAAKIDSGYRSAEIKAWTGAGIVLGEVAKACDSSYRASVRAVSEASVSAGIKLAWIRRLAIENAFLLETSVKEGVKASDSQTDIVIRSGTVLKISLSHAATQAEMDSAFAAFRAAVATVALSPFSLHGQVEGGASGADVHAATVNADGSLKILAGISAHTDAQGGFSLNTDFKLPDSVVLVVTRGDATLMILIDSANLSSSQNPVQVNTESTVEVGIIQHILKEGGAGLVTREDVRIQVDSGVAANVKGDDGAMTHLLAAMEIAARAKAEFLAKAGADIGASAEGKARSLQIYAQTLARFTIGLSAEARFSLIKSAHAQACIALRAAAEAQVKAAGAAEIAIQSLAVAGAALQASLEASADEEAIAKAYADYHAAVNVCLKQAVMLYAAAVDSVDAKIRGADGARAELTGRLKAAADAEAVSKAHLEFSAQVEAQVRAAFGSGLGAPTGAQVEAISQSMILAGMCG
jgi:hypothetical protein